MGTWVFVAYLVYELGVYAIGGEQIIEAALVSTGLMSVLIGVAVGLIPGCGPQIIFVSLYLKGMFPCGAFSQLHFTGWRRPVPLIALEPKSVLDHSIQYHPGLIVGILAYYIQLAF